MPHTITIIFAAIVICVDMYRLCIEAALVTAILFALILLVYFRFTAKGTTAALLTPVFFKLGVPYIMPIATGLLGEVYSIISVVCGTILYYFLSGVHQNASVLASTEELSDNELSKLDILVGQLTGNKEMVLFISVFVIAALVTYFIRKLDTENCWLIAILAGAMIQIVGIFTGNTILGLSLPVSKIIIGGVVSVLLALVIQFFFMNLDYARVEKAQFEDDNYYYYVKAIPKKTVATKEKVVKHYGNTATMGKRVEQKKADDSTTELSRKAFAQEMDIDEDLLK